MTYQYAVDVACTVVLLLHVLVPARTDVIGLFRTECPTTKFCTMDGLSNSTQEDVTSCCLDCFCDEACQVYDDCCPDIHAFRHDVTNDVTHDVTNGVTQHVRCVPSTVQTEYADPRSLFQKNRYRMLDSCPRRSVDSDGVAGKCEEKVYDVDRRFEDMVIVSGQNNVIYRNHYCALCNGEAEAVRWEFKALLCRERLESVRLGASEMKTFIMENCILESTPPPTLPLNSRLFPCQYEVVGNCSEEASFDGTTNETRAGCEMGPYMPFQIGFGDAYKNVLCYRCNSHLAIGPRYCLKAQDLAPRSGTVGLIRLLYFDSSMATTNSNHQCAESKIMDPFTKECRTLYCPPFYAAMYGKCHQIASPVGMSVTVQIVYWPIDNTNVSLPITFYNESMALYYARRVRAKFADISCPGISMTVKINVDRNTSKLLDLMVKTTIGLDERRCTIQGIARIVEHVGFQTSLRESWPINDKLVKMKGRISFFRNAWDNQDPGVFLSYLMRDQDIRVSVYAIDEFIVCPYVKINMHVYNRLLVTAGQTTTFKKLKVLSVKTETMKGVTVLSDSELAICAKLFLELSSGASQVQIFDQFERYGVILLAYLVITHMY